MSPDEHHGVCQDWQSARVLAMTHTLKAAIDGFLEAEREDSRELNPGP
jgi:hypothetical protein